MKYEYEGLLANLCESFIAEKRAIGCIYNTEAKHLREFSRFTCEFTFSENTLPAEVAQAWYTKRVMDSDRNRYARFALVKLFAEYMQRNGYEAYIPTKNELGRLQWSYTPYIFTHEGIHLFFASIDTLKLNRYSAAPQRHIIMPVLFRMLYCCGLRVSEATNLQVKDVSLPDGVLIVRESKFGKTRYIPMSEELTSLCKNYAENKTTGDNNYFFTAPDGNKYGDKAIYCVFREILWKAGISHGGRGKGPRVHDFRHTFAVHSLEKMVREGKELTAALPRLSAYLGHNDLTATERYLRLTSELYPEITAILDQKYGFIIPKKGGIE
jgi:integrase